MGPNLIQVAIINRHTNNGPWLIFTPFHFFRCFADLRTALLTWYLVALVPTLGATSSSNPIMSNHRYDHHSSFFAPSSSSSNNPTHHYVGQSSQSDQPYFSERMQNLTVPVGREATFTCLIHNLKNHQVSLPKGSLFLTLDSKDEERRGERTERG